MNSYYEDYHRVFVFRDRDSWFIEWEHYQLFIPPSKFSKRLRQPKFPETCRH